MGVTPSPFDADATFCLGCGYMLRQLPTNRCPECAREFDPADPRTVSRGRPLRTWQRRMLRPLGWPTIMLAMLGTMGLAFLGYRPHLRLEPWSILRDELRWPMNVPRPLTIPDQMFFAAAGLWLAFFLSAAFRTLGKLAVPRVARRPNQLTPVSRHRRRAIWVAMILSGFFLVFGWEQRVGQRWMARTSSQTPAPLAWGDVGRDGTGQPLFHFSAEQSNLILADLIRDLPTARGRLFALRELIESHGKTAMPALLRAAEHENDGDVLAWELRLIALQRDPATGPFLIAHLQDSRSAIRAAAADAVGILHYPSYSIPAGEDFWVATPLSLDSSPPISLEGMLCERSSPQIANEFFNDHELLDDPPVTLDPSVRSTLEKMMLAGGSAPEREAAARALVAWPPPKYRLRVAEWGVWVDVGGNLTLPRSILSEIPPFVHQTGNPTNSFYEYFHYPSVVTKPIVHLTGDVPLAADVEVHIRHGRPWFAYPLPDDFGVDAGGWNEGAAIGGANLERSRKTNPVRDDIEAPAIEPLLNAREGYPWLIPHHRLRDARFGYSFGTIYNLGLRWQSLIIAPQRLSWMTPPSVSPDPQFAWWSRLREVPCSWIANRGEAERFLYYDGPTRSAVPVAVALDTSANMLRFDVKTERPPEEMERSYRQKHMFEPMQAIRHADLPAREGLFIDARSGVLRGQHMIVNPGAPANLEKNPPLQGAAVIQRFREMLLAYGLTGPEAEGLIAAWTPQFFQTEGRRFILRMAPEDYARQCPMQVRPTPTEVVRLGLILTEFDAPPEKK